MRRFVPVSLSVFVVAAAVTAMLLVNSASGWGEASRPSAGRQWEYQVVDTLNMLVHPQFTDPMIDEMKNRGIKAVKTLEVEFDRLGAQGWELVSYAEHVAVFKRLKKP